MDSCIQRGGKIDERQSEQLSPHNKFRQMLYLLLKAVHCGSQGRAEDFQLGVALRISARAAREKFLSATPKFLSATGIFSF